MRSLDARSFLLLQVFESQTADGELHMYPHPPPTCTVLNNIQLSYLSKKRKQFKNTSQSYQPNYAYRY